MARRRSQVLIKPNPEVAAQLRSQPDQWFLVGVGDLNQARTLSTTAWRIGLNYRDGKGLRDFTGDDCGYFEASATADQSRPNQKAPVELFARYCRRNPESPPSGDEGLS